MVVLSAKVSVIIPTYRRPQFLQRAVQSVLNQTYDNIEVVVVDDNMPDSEARDKTAELMMKYASDDRVKYVCNARSMGGGPARNEGIKAANGEYITFLDDDDEYLPCKVEVQLAFVLENGLEMAFSDVCLCDANGKTVEYRRHDYVTDCSNAELLRQHILHSLGPTSTFMIRRDVLLNAGGFIDVPMGQDFMLMWRMIEAGTKIGYFPESNIIQYLHDEGRISTGKNKIDGENRLYKLKMQHTDNLTKKEVRYVRFRHYAVLAASSKRSKAPVAALGYGIHAALSSPIYTAKEAIKFYKSRSDGKTVSQGITRTENG